MEIPFEYLVLALLVAIAYFGGLVTYAMFLKHLNEAAEESLKKGLSQRADAFKT